MQRKTRSKSQTLHALEFRQFTLVVHSYRRESSKHTDATHLQTDNGSIDDQNKVHTATDYNTIVCT